MVVTIDIKTLNLSRTSVFSGGPSTAGGAGKKKNSGGGGILEDVDSVIKLSYKQRLIGFAMCLLAGVVVIGMAYVCIYFMRPVGFAICFTLGNILAIISTMFLMGPCAQLKRMFDTVRIAATIVFLLSMFLTLYFAYSHIKLKIFPVVACGVVQLLALIWYSLSYIPYARSMARRCMGV